MFRTFHLQFKIASGIIFLMLFYFQSYSQKKFIVPTTVNLIDGQLGAFANIQSGDTIVLESGVRELLILRNLRAEKGKEIVIMNDSGVVEFNSSHYFGISVRNCRYIILSGAGNSSIKYGIRILNIQGCGLTIGDFSSDFEIENIEISNTLYSGISAKTEPDCNFNRNDFIQENTIIHDCYVHHTKNEGMYIGSSFYEGQTIMCNGNQTQLLPPLLKYVNVYNNIVEYTGWDGIQVSSAVFADINNNVVRYDSQEKRDWQMTGITLGGGSTGRIYNNVIYDGEGMGIFTNALGEVFVFNNIIKNPGKNNSKSSGAFGIYVDDKGSISGMNFSVFNNLILNAKRNSIRLISNFSYLKNSIKNNIIVQVNAINNGIKMDVNNSINESNLQLENTEQLFFRNEDDNDFNFNEGSILIDAGVYIEGVHQYSDVNGNSRIQGNKIDIGPIESSYSKNNLIIDEHIPVKANAFPNPVLKDKFYSVIFNVEIPGKVKINLIDKNGKIIRKLFSGTFSNGNQSANLVSNDLNTGLNLIQISCEKNQELIRVIKD